MSLSGVSRLFLEADLEAGAATLFFGVTGFSFAGVFAVEGGLGWLLAPLTSLREDKEVRLLTDLLTGFFGGVSTKSRELKGNVSMGMKVMLDVACLGTLTRLA